MHTNEYIHTLTYKYIKYCLATFTFSMMLVSCSTLTNKYYVAHCIVMKADYRAQYSTINSLNENTHDGYCLIFQNVFFSSYWPFTDSYCFHL